jgi:hypothetical protein
LTRKDAANAQTPPAIMNTLPPSIQPVAPPLASQRCGLAVWSLVLGIAALVLSVVCVGPLLAIPAVICGHKALGRIKRSGGTLAGEGLATGGLITGYTGIALIPILLLLSAIAVPNFMRARDIAQRNQCINNLRQIDAAKQEWALEREKQQDAVPTWNELSPFLKTNYQALVCPKGGTYTIGAVKDLPTCSVPGHTLPE